MIRFVILAALTFSVACDGDLGGTADGAISDAATDSDSGATDSGATDSGANDSGIMDSGAIDSGRGDSGPSDGGVDGGVDGGRDSGVDLDFVPRTLRSAVTRVQPMTGIVLWENSHNGDPIKTSDAVQLEYAYFPPSSIVTARDTYDWRALDGFLDRIAGRSHQALVRFYYTYPGRETVVPAYIKALPDYDETVGTTEGMRTVFPDWSHPELRRAHRAFLEAFAARYDDDARVAFLQIGFGLWGEYHIYDGPNDIGEQFPSHAYQRELVRALDAAFTELSWSVSIDAGSSYYAPFATDAALRALRFGNFDDSFMHSEHHRYNRDMWRVFGHETRMLRAPHGGELSYYTTFDQRNVLNIAGIHGRTYEELSAQYNITYMIGNDQPRYQSTARIRDAGMANGYRFAITTFETSTNAANVTVRNNGAAPIYYDAYVAVNGVRSADTLKGLAPGASLTTRIGEGGASPTVTIECDRLVAGQSIQFDAEL